MPVNIPGVTSLVRLFLTYLSSSLSLLLELWAVEGLSSRSSLPEAAAAKKRAGAVLQRFCDPTMYSVSGMLWLTRDIRCLTSSTSASLCSSRMAWNTKNVNGYSRDKLLTSPDHFKTLCSLTSCEIHVTPCNSPFHDLWRHFGSGGGKANTVKITVLQ